MLMSSSVLSIIKSVFTKVHMNSTKPVVVVIGYTGAGKSKLAIEIAKKYKGEIINADAMQLYKGLDLVTNKVTEEEKQNVPHHLLGFVEPQKQFTVVDFQLLGLDIIKRLHEENKLPVIVGGTNYYVESLLYEILVDEGRYSGVGEGVSVTKASANKCIIWDLKPHKNCDQALASEVLEKLKASAEEDVDLHSLLRKADPDYAAYLHPNDKRKVQRALEVWLGTGTPMSAHKVRQQEDAGTSDIGGPIRFPNSAIIWVDCDREVLNERLDDRVDQMVTKGLVEEIDEFHNSYSKKFFAEGVQNPYEFGVCQSIGVKEFHDYLSLPDYLRDSKEGKKLLQESIKVMKVRTKKYASMQLKWKRSRLMKRDRQLIPLYEVDSTNVSEWDDRVSKVADDVVSNLIKGKSPKSTKPTNLPSENIEKIYTKRDVTHYTCAPCGATLIGKIQYTEHMEGSKHRRQMKRIEKLAARQDREAQQKDEEDRSISYKN